MITEELIQAVKESEGFRSRVYKCTEGFDTIGYGFAIKDLELDEEICEMILQTKLNKMCAYANRKMPFLMTMPVEIQDVVLEMCYQIGVDGVTKFKKTLALLKREEFAEAAVEMLDSKWAKQTPNRAKRLSEKVKSCD
ncbi:MAG: putative endolysin [Prokaryotic dsDNA virus sp.]|nr:MAG: putative endolysin [Prokaryotic dsDNA virus sp.]